MKIRKAELTDIDKIHEIMWGFGLDPSIFIASSKERIKELIPESIVCEHGDEIIGFILIEGSDYIDTICSTVDGVGRLMLSHLPTGRYEVNVSDKNNRSLHLFKLFGFKLMKHEIVEGQDRGRYEGYIKQGHLN